MIPDVVPTLMLFTELFKSAVPDKVRVALLAIVTAAANDFSPLPLKVRLL